MKIFNIFILLALSLFSFLTFSSCLNFSPSRTILHADTVEYSISTMVNSIDPAPGAYIEIDSFYASKAPNKSADSINYYTKSMTYPAGLGYQAMIDTFMAQYSSALKDYPDMYASWEAQMKVSVNLNESGIFSMTYNFYEFTGGAHPNGWTYFLNFDLSTGKPIRFEEIFTRDEIIEINKRAEVIFRDVYGLDPEGSLEEAGYWFDNNKFSLNNNFLVKENSLYFIFNSYEIAPYVAGPSEIEIPYSQIEDLIDDYNPLKKLL
ncbi:DUF3298 domain-containing protein [candidate division WOR-3 bacterium]|nr:DUF3298 domain-containing protein [candidate division WOR-3 bacterium]